MARTPLPATDGCSDLLHGFLTGTEADEIRRRRLYGRLPSNPRCILCYAPFGPPGARLMRLRGRRPFAKNPRICEVCFRAMAVGGCEIEIVTLFVDVRGSTALADQVGASEYAATLDRFYGAAIEEMIAAQAFVEITGDEVYAFYVPALTPGNPAKIAIEAAARILTTVDWLDLGSAVHAGRAWVGVVGHADRIKDFRSVGDTVNVGARLVAAAGPGECLISEVACELAGQPTQGLESRTLSLKGKREPMHVRVVRIGAGAAP
jgi:adenylate cyclase